MSAAYLLLLCGRPTDSAIAQGVNLGRSGRVTMIQLAAHPAHVLCFDMLRLGIKVCPLLLFYGMSIALFYGMAVGRTETKP